MGLWIKDIHSDRQNVVTTLEEISLYSIWKCGLNCGNENKIGDIPAGQNLDVLRIRYGKDFMAVKVEYNQEEGWLIYDSKLLQINKKTALNNLINRTWLQNSQPGYQGVI